MSVASFLAGVRATESASPYAYGQMVGQVRGGRKLGAYGIASDDWAHMAAEAGIPGARWADPAAQDYVATMTAHRLHRKYGDWRLVAAAWHGGETVADALSADPSLFTHPNLQPLKVYVTRVMTEARKTGTVSDREPVETEPFDPDTSTLSGDAAAGSTPSSGRAEDVLRRRLAAMRDRVRAGGAQEEIVAPEVVGPQ